MFDPLTQYHTTLRASQASGYPQMNYFMPHPYAMSAFNFQQKFSRDKAPYAMNHGRNLRIWPKPKYNQGIGQRIGNPTRRRVAPPYHLAPGVAR